MSREVSASTNVPASDTAVLEVAPSWHQQGALGPSITADEACASAGSSIVAECLDGVWKSINSIGVVEWLSTKSEKSGVVLGGCAVINVAVRLYNPYEFLAWMVEVKADLVGRRTNRFRASELELLNEVLVWLLSHAAALISVKVDVIYVERSGNKGLAVSSGYLHVRASSILISSVHARYSPEALINCAEVEVYLDLVVLKSNEWKSKAWVAAEPELKRDVEGGLWESIARSAYLAWSVGIARSINISERWVSYEGKLGGVTNHLVVALLLVLVHGELAPDVHPVTVLFLDALTANLNFYVFDELVAWEIEPASV